MKRVDPQGFVLRNCRNPVPSRASSKRRALNRNESSAASPTSSLDVDNTHNFNTQVGILGPASSPEASSSSTYASPQYGQVQGFDVHFQNFHPDPYHEFDSDSDSADSPALHQLPDGGYDGPDALHTSVVAPQPQHLSYATFRHPPAPTTQATSSQAPAAHAETQARSAPYNPPHAPSTTAIPPRVRPPEPDFVPTSIAPSLATQPTQLPSHHNSTVVAIAQQITSANHMLAVSVRLQETLMEHKYCADPARKAVLENTMREMAMECTAALHGVDSAATRTLDVLRASLPEMFQPVVQTQPQPQPPQATMAPLPLPHPPQQVQPLPHAPPPPPPWHQQQQQQRIYPDMHNNHTHASYPAYNLR